MKENRYLLLENKKDRADYDDFINDPINTNIVNEHKLNISLEEIFKYRDFIISENYSFTDNYTHILIHETLFNKSQKNLLKSFENFIKNTCKTLILFSGGYDNSYDFRIDENVIRLLPYVLYNNLSIYLENPTLENLLGDKFDNRLI